MLPNILLFDSVPHSVFYLVMFPTGLALINVIKSESTPATEKSHLKMKDYEKYNRAFAFAIATNATVIIACAVVVPFTISEIVQMKHEILAGVKHFHRRLDHIEHDLPQNGNSFVDSSERTQRAVKISQLLQDHERSEIL
ncbi:unnamed protein product [Gongylonema pulchrum]|uniref:Col_cuticle_N domain-containing protein n=1 Tax=Gongylonema pulchrum TaxID=637853 RepID=A0A183CY93_9BILA|nr:unnamed protein product [Gongylonema pulchrum]